MSQDLILLVHKPVGYTSFGIVKELRKLLSIKKIGHTGTLDPFASGLLILCTGKKTKRASHYQNLEKVYRGEIILGKTTASFDKETPVEKEMPWQHLTLEALEVARKAFIGHIFQVPPRYAALKIDGKRAYARARKGEKFTLAPRPVLVHSFAITQVSLPVVHIEIKCGKGVYIRSIAHDFGHKLGVGGYLHALERTQIGPYRLSDAYTLETLADAIKKGELLRSLEPFEI